MPVANSRILLIEASTGIADGLDKAARARILWEGNSDAYLMSKRARVYSGDQSSTVREVFIYVPVEITRRIEISPGDRLTVIFNGHECSFVAQDITDSVLLDALGATCVRVERA